MSDFTLDDALAGHGNAGNLQSQGQGQGQPQNYNPWGGQNPGQQYPGFPGQGQPYQGFPGAGQGQQYPGNPGQGQPYPGFQGPGQGQQYPGQQFPGYPSFQGPGQSYPGAPAPGQGPTAPSAPSVPSGPKKLPCELPLPAGITNGMMLTLAGVPNGKRFCIDYKQGPNVAFHFNPRFDERPCVVVRNTMINDEWGPEERQCPKFPFQQGQPFKIQILFDQNCYRVMVNNENFCQYVHRLKNFSGINVIRIDGDLTISDVSLTTV